MLLGSYRTRFTCKQSIRYGDTLTSHLLLSHVEALKYLYKMVIIIRPALFYHRLASLC